MTKGDKPSGMSRRGFLSSVGGAGTAAAAAVAGVVVPEHARAAESEAERKKARYKESDHVKAYYRTNRY
jgi:hypothetical protein